MKKFLIVAFIEILCISLLGCSNGSKKYDDNNYDNEKAISTTIPKDNKNIPVEKTKKPSSEATSEPTKPSYNSTTKPKVPNKSAAKSTTASTPNDTYYDPINPSTPIKPVNPTMPNEPTQPISTTSPVNLENDYVEKIDGASISYTNDKGELLYNQYELLKKAGISIKNIPIVYKDVYTFSQHMENVSKIFYMYGVSLSTSSGLWSYASRDSLSSDITGLGRILQVPEDKFNGQYTGKTVIIADDWRSTITQNIAYNIDYNLFLACYKYFLGENAGEDLWSLIDDNFLNHRFDSKRFNFTIIEKESSSKDYYDHSDYSVYELNHSSGAKVVMYTAPNNRTGFNIIVIKRGN